MKPKKYPFSIILIHWLTVILFAIIFYVGITMEEYEFNEANMYRYRTHALLGMLLMIVTLVRIVIKRKNVDNLPVEISYYSNAHRTFVNTLQWLIYLLLIFAPLVGFVMVYQTGALSYDLGGPFPEGAHFNEYLVKLHEVLVFSLMALVFVHVVGVLMYSIKNNENLIKRMCLLL